MVQGGGGGSLRRPAGGGVGAAGGAGSSRRTKVMQHMELSIQNGQQDLFYNLSAGVTFQGKQRFNVGSLKFLLY